MNMLHFKCIWCDVSIVAHHAKHQAEIQNSVHQAQYIMLSYRIPHFSFRSTQTWLPWAILFYYNLWVSKVCQAVSKCNMLY